MTERKQGFYIGNCTSKTGQMYLQEFPKDDIARNIRLFADNCVLYRAVNKTSETKDLQDDLSTLAQCMVKHWQLH